MKTIDLKKYYSSPLLYEESDLVDVTDEVAYVLEQSMRDEKNYHMKCYRAKAYYSLDYGNGIENYVISREKTPEEMYEWKLTMQQFHQALSKLTKKQGQHIYAFYFLNKTCKEIAAAEHITPRTVQISLQRGRKRLGKILKNNAAK